MRTAKEIVLAGVKKEATRLKITNNGSLPRIHLGYADERDKAYYISTQLYETVCQILMRDSSWSLVKNNTWEKEKR